jgi:hypothetical protein
MKGWTFPVVVDGPWEGLWVFVEGETREQAVDGLGGPLGAMADRLGVSGAAFGVFIDGAVPMTGGEARPNRCGERT